eukprot:113004-Pelagomonas_calceolata.AAC.3
MAAHLDPLLDSVAPGMHSPPAVLPMQLQGWGGAAAHALLLAAKAGKAFAGLLLLRATPSTGVVLDDAAH